jgi:hypothetical protein
MNKILELIFTASIWINGKEMALKKPGVIGLPTDIYQAGYRCWLGDRERTIEGDGYFQNIVCSVKNQSIISISAKCSDEVPEKDVGDVLVRVGKTKIELVIKCESAQPEVAMSTAGLS